MKTRATIFLPVICLTGVLGWGTKKTSSIPWFSIKELECPSSPQRRRSLRVSNKFASISTTLPGRKRDTVHSGSGEKSIILLLV
ncbi:hypothetical protein J3R30DRAFT_3463895, partial [Lentinula aciculospora]